ncbi:hypothetical protein AVEN_86313-1 [Araneus ventricosus]|uniref:Uncharacterized protein n=1 Tax=Araneus ventricosus TaxID=182803 RepID=A0A4Y2PKK4_ARAVE|nr:hypothetical protein AVEN_86313-1 [Araneus ventricosus]
MNIDYSMMLCNAALFKYGQLHGSCVKETNQPHFSSLTVVFSSQLKIHIFTTSHCPNPGADFEAIFLRNFIRSCALVSDSLEFEETLPIFQQVEILRKMEKKKLAQGPKKSRKSKVNDITDEERLLLYAELAEEQRRARYGLPTLRKNVHTPNVHTPHVHTPNVHTPNVHTPNGHNPNEHTQNGKPRDEPLH